MPFCTLHSFACHANTDASMQSTCRAWNTRSEVLARASIAHCDSDALSSAHELRTGRLDVQTTRSPDHQITRSPDHQTNPDLRRLRSGVTSITPFNFCPHAVRQSDFPCATIRKAIVMDDGHIRGSSCCPHVDRNDPRCMHRFSLGRIDQAFSVCFGAFHGCPMFHRINRDEHAAQRSERPSRRSESEASALISVTAHGVPVPIAVNAPRRLCATGT